MFSKVLIFVSQLGILTLYVLVVREAEVVAADVVSKDKEKTKRMRANIWSLMMAVPAEDRAVTRRENCR
jgi:hypothetical protein